MSKIVFIINSISAQRCIKRVEEFIAHGYEVEAYGFSRRLEMHSQPKHFSLEVIGEYDNSLSFPKRVPIMKRGIRKVLQRHEKEKNTVYYLFQLDVALVFKMLTRSNRYIYEESDLMHTYIGNGVVRGVLEVIDKWIIKKSLMSVFTSEGFLMYHYGEKRPDNIWVIANRLNPDIEKVSKHEKTMEKGKLRIGFVGFPRYNSVISFARIICKNFPQCEFHVYGELKGRYEKDFEALRHFPNCFLHGAFLNPDDLPLIYSEIDVVLSTYDVEYENVRYAEPNKMYEAIYFETPIIVSEGTFLETKVKKLGIGYSVNPMDEEAVVLLLKGMTGESLVDRMKNCMAIEKKECLNINEDFFKRIEKLL